MYNTIEEYNLINKSWRNLALIPNKSVDLKTQCLKINGHAIQYIDNLTIDDCENATKQNGYAIMHIPKKYQTPKIRLLAILQQPNSIMFIDNPDKLEMLTATALDPRTVKYFIDKFMVEMNPEIIDKILSNVNIKDLR